VTLTLASIVAVDTTNVTIAELGGEAVLLHAGTGIYFSLNSVGLRTWKLAAEQQRTVEALATEIAKAFDCNLDDVRNDVAAFVSTLLDYGLATVVNSSLPGSPRS